MQKTSTGGENDMSKQATGKGRKSRWTKELVAQLLELWEQGLSASDIAAKLGHGLTRNAVIGKVHRLRAQGKAPQRRDNDAQKADTARTAGKPAAGAAARTREAARTTARRTTATGASAKGALAVDVLADTDTETITVESEDQRLQLVVNETGLIQDIMDLDHQSCRWPIGTPGEEGFSYCGRKAGDGKPYCAHHAAVAYTSSGSGR